jgi:hypothetical protein
MTQSTSLSHPLNSGDALGARSGRRSQVLGHSSVLPACSFMTRASGASCCSTAPIWSHFGGTWGLPGGARHEHETAYDAATSRGR